MRVAPLLVLAVALPAAAQAPAKRTVEFTGLVLVNGFYNSAHVANVDRPLFAETDNIGVETGGAFFREARLRLLLPDPNEAGRRSASGNASLVYAGRTARP